LSPAEIARVIIDEDNQSMEVIVNDEYLSIAIGKGGQNVSLACEITGWHLEVTSEEEYSREVKEGYDSLMKLSTVGLPAAESLFKAGYASFLDIMDAIPEDIAAFLDISVEDAQAMIEEAGRLMEDEREKAREELLQPAPSKDTDTYIDDNAGDGETFADVEDEWVEKSDE
jgi:N utilization substance protein A